MFYADYHMHTRFSSDSDASLESMIEKSIALGLKEIAVTDHIDFDYPDPDFPFHFDYDTYSKALLDAQEKYKGKITIRKGVEMGLQSYLKEKISSYHASHSFDFIIGSTHCVNKTELFGLEFFKGKTQKQAYQDYFEDVLKSVRTFDEYDVYGHMDYINRYSPYDNKDLYYEDYKEIIDEILKEIIQRGKGLEVNTSGFKYGLGQTHPQEDILVRYRQLGGEIITVGSDSHSPSTIASYFEIAYELLKDAGFKAVTVFQNRKPSFIDLK